VAEEEIREIVEVRDGRDRQLLVDLADEYGARLGDVGVRTLDPTTFAELIGGVTVLRLIIERWQDRRRGGQIIDLRSGAEKIAYRDADLLFGYVVMFLPDGRVDVQVNDKDRVNDFVERLIAAFTKGRTTATVDNVVPLLNSLGAEDAQLRIERGTTHTEEGGQPG